MKKYTTKFSQFTDHRHFYKTFALVYIFYGIVYLSWLSLYLNPQNMYLAFAFLITQVATYISVTISMINHWNMKYRSNEISPMSPMPAVAVVISVYKEPIEIIKKTLNSVIDISYNGKLIVVLSNDYINEKYVDELNILAREINKKIDKNENIELIVRTSEFHKDAKAGNLNQAVRYLRANYPEVDFLLTQDADEIAYPHILNRLMGYFRSKNVAFVQSIKQVKTSRSDPFGNNDYMFYARTAPARDADNSMFACGSGVVWRISAVESVGGFSTWNLVEDLTTSYELLSKGWESRYHFEPLSKGLAPEDLPNYIKQRGTWAIDTMRIFFWDNPIFKKGLSLKQKLHFLEIPLFYLNGVFLMALVLITSFSLLFEVWPTRATALDHAVMLLPSFIALELYYIALAGKIPFYRTRQFWIGLAPVYLVSIIKALVYGPNNKPEYKVTRKTNKYGNYLYMAWPQIAIILLVVSGMLKSVFMTPIYSAFDWATFFWGIYIASFFVQFIKVSLWKWSHSTEISLGTQRRVTLSYAPDIL